MKRVHLDFDSKVAVAEIPDEGLAFDLKFAGDALDSLAERLNLVSAKSLAAEGEILVKRDIVLFRGIFAAEITQRCVVSLREIPTSVSEDIYLELVSEEEADARDRDEAYLDLDAPEYDTLDGDTLVPGEVVAQTLSMALDPYPRHPDAELTDAAPKGVEINEAPIERENPFAALKDMNKKS